MFDIGADELLLTAVVAIVVIGPKDMPRALRTLGKWVAKMRRMSTAFRSGIENVIREAELEEMEQEWRKQNAAIMSAHPADAAEADALAAAAAAHGNPAALPPPVDSQAVTGGASPEAGEARPVIADARIEPLSGFDPPAADVWMPPAPAPVPAAGPENPEKSNG